MSTSSAIQWHDTRLAAVRKWESACPYEDFIDDGAIEEALSTQANPDKAHTLAIVEKARDNARAGAMLSPEDVAVLANTQDRDCWEAIYDAANWIKRAVYGNRIVLFAPLYISSPCVNNCAYCGFRTSNDAVSKRTLTMDELDEELAALVGQGHKRLVLVYGEHPSSDHEFICETIARTYSVRRGYGEIRRANINAAPLFVDEYEAVRASGIGTYQVFQETYHHETYRKVHPQGTLKGEYRWRQFALHRALEAGIDDVALGVLFGLYDWRFELLAMLHHAVALEKAFDIGPHTMSYPRLEPALNTPLATRSPHVISDEDFKRAVAIIRLMCPYTGSILTARESPAVRREVMRDGGVSQMDAGSRIAVGGYAQMEHEHIPDRQQFILGDARSLDEFVYDLCRDGYLPSFCTAGYREGRTGANFMPLAKHATVNRFCIANGVLTFKEYLLDYASPETRAIGERVIHTYLEWIDANVPQLADKVRQNLEREGQNQRDLHF
ncbi:MAG: [FeFe] hydrogenase H-cluster radical SAM maturase HydG [Candidatus Hydrogenedentes bacterium]|nr:[FeFe] hydrogenase H-cluster radical SAM maturase HydG [Candidatus Hydrogenedentota bacterium]